MYLCIYVCISVQIKKANWIGHIWRRNCLLKHVIDEKVESRMDRCYLKACRRHQELMYDLKKSRGYWKLKEEALDCTQWRTVFERFYGNCRMTDYGINEWVMNEWMNEWMNENKCKNILQVQRNCIQHFNARVAHSENCVTSLVRSVKTILNCFILTLYVFVICKKWFCSTY